LNERESVGDGKPIIIISTTVSVVIISTTVSGMNDRVRVYN